MAIKGRIRSYDYVNHPYEPVRLALTSDPLAIFSHATSRGLETAAAGSELEVRLGGIEVGTEIDIELVSAQPARSPAGKQAYSISFAWTARRHAGWFPTMTATLTMYPLTPTETQLDFDGIYVPPLGAIGAALDAAALHRVAEAAVGGFLREVAAYVRAALSRPRDDNHPPAP